MSFDWIEYFYFAKEFSSNPGPACSQEADYRTAITRAYYAAFIKARDFIEKKDGGLVDFGKGTHENVIKQFERSSDTNLNTIAIYLRQIRYYRVSADYYSTFNGKGKTMLQALDFTVDTAEDIIETLKTL